MPLFACRFVPVVCLLLLSGCSGPADAPPFAPVTGIVSLDGKPLTRGKVYFLPDKEKGTKGPMAIGEIQPDGTYTLKSASGEGAMVGHHRVRVEARAEPKDQNDTQPPYIIPARYDNPQTSKLTAEVKAEQENVVPLDLTSDK